MTRFFEVTHNDTGETVLVSTSQVLVVAPGDLMGATLILHGGYAIHTSETYDKLKEILVSEVH